MTERSLVEFRHWLQVRHRHLSVSPARQTPDVPPAIGPPPAAPPALSLADLDARLTAVEDQVARLIEIAESLFGTDPGVDPALVMTGK
jgi:hypothetical protein